MSGIYEQLTLWGPSRETKAEEEELRVCGHCRELRPASELKFSLWGFCRSCENRMLSV